MDLNKDLEQLPEDSTIVVRSKSALGLKYLQINRGDSSQGFKPGSTMPLTAARPEPVEIDQVFNMFDSPTRTAIQANLLEFGNALAGRGVDLNAAIGQLKPLVELLTPVMRNLADPNTGLSNFVSSLSATAAEVAPVAEIQGQLFADLDTTFAAFARVSRPFIQESISKVAGGGGHRDRDAADDPALPRQHGQALQRAAAGLPCHRTGAEGASARAIVEGVKALPLAPALNAQLDPDGAVPAQPLQQRERAERHHAPDRLQQRGSGRRSASSRPRSRSATTRRSLFRNAASLASYNDGVANGQRFIVLQPPLAQGQRDRPELRARQRAGGLPANFLHYNPYPNTASPGQTRECEAGNEGYPPASMVIGNVPGNQGIHTGRPDPPAAPEEQKKKKKKGKK